MEKPIRMFQTHMFYTQVTDTSKKIFFENRIFFFIIFFILKYLYISTKYKNISAYFIVHKVLSAYKTGPYS